MRPSEATAAHRQPKYEIGTVARLTNVKTDTLRAWDRRYGLGPSTKSSSGRRLYSQTELEHLQIVAALVEQGYRIGEIASLQRKTLEAMQGLDASSSQTTPAAVPTIGFVGDLLCDWLSTRPGMCNGLRAVELRYDLSRNIQLSDDALPVVDALVIYVSRVTGQVEMRIKALHGMAGRVPALVIYQSDVRTRRQSSDDSNLIFTSAPLNESAVAANIELIKARAALVGDGPSVEALVAPKPRIFDPADLEKLSTTDSDLSCACPEHLSRLILALSEFETYSSQCAVDNWAEAAAHACVYSYTNQARWLIEKALQAATESHL